MSESADSIVPEEVLMWLDREADHARATHRDGYAISLADAAVLIRQQATTISALERQSAERIAELERALEACITDAPYAQTIGAPNRIGAINRIACAAINKHNNGGGGNG